MMIFDGLKDELINKDHVWIETFIQHGGLFQLLQWMTTNCITLPHQNENLGQIAIACIKLLMNLPQGMDHVAHNHFLIQQLLQRKYTIYIALIIFISIKSYILEIGNTSRTK